MRHTIRPLDRWPEQNTSPRRSGSIFKTPWDKTLQMLGKEAEHLGADLIVIEIVAPDSARKRADGSIHAATKSTHPGAVVNLTTPRGPLRFATDAHEARYYNDPPEWQMNVHAITLGLHALRAVDRYGITSSGQQYTGWLQIESGAIALPAGMTKDEAAAVIGEMAGWRIPPDWMDPRVVQLAYRDAARLHHPDAGGDRANWDRLEAAMRALGGAS